MAVSDRSDSSRSNRSPAPRRGPGLPYATPGATRYRAHEGFQLQPRNDQRQAEPCVTESRQTRRMAFTDAQGSVSVELRGVAIPSHARKFTGANLGAAHHYADDGFRHQRPPGRSEEGRDPYHQPGSQYR